MPDFQSLGGCSAHGNTGCADKAGIGGNLSFSSYLLAAATRHVASRKMPTILRAKPCNIWRGKTTKRTPFFSLLTALTHLALIAGTPRLDGAIGHDSSTQSFDYSDTTVVAAGYLASSAPYFILKSTSQWDFSVSGSSAQIQILSKSTGDSFSVSVDGSSWVTVNDVAGNYTTEYLPLFSGLSDGPHTVSFRPNSENYTVTQTATFSVTGSAPSIRYAPGFSKPYALAQPDGSLLKSFALEGVLYRDSNGTPLVSYDSIPIWNRTSDPAVRFRGNCAGVQFYVSHSGASRWYLYEDGVRGAHIDLANLAGAMAWESLPTSGASGQHEYVLVCAADSNQARLTNIMAPGICTDALPPRARWLFALDSLTFAQSTTELGDTLGDATNGHARKLGVRFNRDVRNYGIPFQPVSLVDTSAWKLDDPEAIILLGGINDDVAYHENATQFRSACDAVLAGALSNCPNAIIFVTGLTDAPGHETTQASFNAAWQAAISANGSNRLRWAPLVGCFQPLPIGNYVGGDGVHAGDGEHMNSLGYDRMVNRLAPYLAELTVGSGYTVTFGGSIGTLTLAAGATFDGTESVVISSSVGTVTAASSSATITDNGTSRVTITPFDGQTSILFTPSTASTITYGNAQGWVDAAPTNLSAGGGEMAPPVIIGTPTVKALVGVGFAYAITATDSPTAYAVQGLPAGLSVNTTTGLISGTPSTAGTSTVTLYATNDGGTAISTAVFSVAPIPQATISLGAQGSATLSVDSLADASYQLQGSSDLLNWSNIGSLQTGTGHQLSFSVDAEPGVARFFYRIAITFASSSGG